MISDVKSPRPPFSKGGRPLWVAISSSFPLLQRGMEGDFHARGRQDRSVMSVYERINIYKDRNEDEMSFHDKRRTNNAYAKGIRDGNHHTTNSR